jgi:5'(3')-deoxyribonucleotidase
LRIGIDVDEVCAQLHRTWIEDYNQEYQDNLTMRAVDCWDFYLKTKAGKGMMDLLTPEMYDRVKPYPGAAEAVTQLRRLGHEVVYVSSCVNGTAEAKEKWLERHGFFEARDGFHAMNDKTWAPCDVLIDDHLENVRSFRGWGVLHNRGHNVHLRTWHHRVNSLFEFADLLGRDRMI